MKRIIIISSLTLIIVLLNINFVVPNLNDPATSIQYEQITKIDSSTSDSSKVNPIPDSSLMQTVYFGRGMRKVKSTVPKKRKLKKKSSKKSK